MPNVNLTDRFIQGIVGTGERQEFQDAKVRGLVLRVAQSGDPKTWSLVYRSPVNGKKQRFTLGVYPSLTLADARTAAQLRIGEIAKGVDPVASKREARLQSMTVADLVEQYQTRQTVGLRSAEAVQWRLGKYVVPVMGTTRLADWHRRDVTLMLDKLAAGTPGSANRVFDDLRAMSKWAVRVGYLDLDPLAAIERPAEAKARDRVLTADEIKSVFERLDATTMTVALRRMIRLLFLTACRTSEISELAKTEVDLEANVIRLPAERVKNGRPFVVPLVAEAVEILTDAIKDANDSDFVFPSPTAEEPGPIDGHAISVAVRRNLERFGAGQWTPHDIRRSVATHLAEDLATPPHIIEVLLNHVSGFRRSVAGTYNRATYAKEHREALELWAGWLTGIRAGRNNVVSIAEARQT